MGRNALEFEGTRAEARTEARVELRADPRVEDWACDRAEEIMLREGLRLIHSARSGSNSDIRETSLIMARAIAASLIEASAAREDDGR
jgi:hypothetical protein